MVQFQCLEKGNQRAVKPLALLISLRVMGGCAALRNPIMPTELFDDFGLKTLFLVRMDLQWDPEMLLPSAGRESEPQFQQSGHVWPLQSHIC